MRGAPGLASESSRLAFPPLPRQTLTHYDIPLDYIASCGCVGRSTRYPTTAINRLAYGSNTSFGPICGSCVKLTLTSTPLTPLPGPNGSGGDGISYTPEEQASGEAPSVVVKVTDLCPGVGGPHCNATAAQGNALGAKVHFDLAWPSPARGAIPANFFPGDHDYGVWNVSYAFVSCDQWAGAADRAAGGSDWAQESAACCPTEPPLPGSPTYGETVLRSQQAQLAANGSTLPATCPPYWLTRQADPALVPNTSNILSKSNSAANPRAIPSAAAAATGVLSALAVSLLLLHSPLHS